MNPNSGHHSNTQGTAAPGHSSPRVQQRLLYFGGINNSLIGLKAYSVGGTVLVLYCQCSQLPMPGEVMAPRREPTTGIFLKQYSSQLLSNCLSLRPQINTALTPNQRNFFLQQRVHPSNPQLVKTQRVSDHRYHPLYSCNTAHAPQTQGASWTRRRMDC